MVISLSSFCTFADSQDIMIEPDGLSFGKSRAVARPSMQLACPLPAPKILISRRYTSGADAQASYDPVCIE